MKDTKIAIIGGGTAGSSIALYLSDLGLDVTLFEQEESLVNGPPFCHLHAGGNLYREISDEQCVTLLKESIDLLRYYPFAVDYRPTVIAVPTQDKGKPDDLCARLSLLQKEYEKLIRQDPENSVLGASSDYFRTFTKDELLHLSTLPSPEHPKTPQEWMIPIAKNLDFTKVQFPLIMVQEYGLNLFRLGAGASLALEQRENVHLHFNTKVVDLTSIARDEGWSISFEHKEKIAEEHFDFLINAAGFRSGTVDDMLQFKRERLVEFKAAYVTKWSDNHERWPEVVFYGERGTPQGMAQFTPYPGGYFQLHGMTKAITLFDKGLVRSNTNSAQPKLDSSFLKRIEQKWEFSEVQDRTQAAIKHLAQYIPSFKTAQVASKPLFGAQQIPGDDPSLRAANVSFVGEHYARCEIIKVSSVLSMSDAVTQQLIELGYLASHKLNSRHLQHLKQFSEEELQASSKTLSKRRGYPLEIANRSVHCQGC